MASAESLVALFEAITANLERDRDDLNQLDRDDGDSGDNMVANFQLVTSTLRRSVGPAQGGNADLGAALSEAAQVLRENGKGATAPIYAEGLDEAAGKFQGKSGFQLDDLLPLLEGMLGGAQRANSTQPGEGSLLDVLLPGVLAYMQGKRDGQGDLEAILGALLSVRRGANSTSRSSRGYGKGESRDTRGEIDPGAAGAASLLEGLFGALLQSAVRGQGNPAGRSAPAPAPDQRAPSSSDMIIDVLGGLFSQR